MHLLILKKFSPELTTKLQTYVPHFEQEALLPERLSVSTRRLVSLAIARSILFDHYNFTHADVMMTEIVRLDTGAPLLKTPTNKGLNISISHSGDWFACVISDSFEKTCIDLEDKSLTRKWQAVSKRYFSTLENDYVIRNGINGFYKIWTTKEALAKLVGKGLEKVLNIQMDNDFLAQESIFENEGTKICHVQTVNYYYTLATKK